MRNTLVIAWRELEERRLIPVAVIAFALMPVVLAAIPGIGGDSPREAITVGSMLLLVIITLGLAAALGASMVGRDLSEGRMSFYFSRPVAATSIWAGKVFAALILIVLSFLLLAVPASLFGIGRWEQLWQLADIGAAQGFAIVLGAAAALFLLAHIFATFFRSRSPLIFLDTVAVALCGVAVPALFRPLIDGMGQQLATGLAIGLGGALLLVLICGGAWQLEHGRTDQKRNHYALSKFLWSTLAIAILIGAAFVTWVVSAGPSDLIAQIQGQRAPAGPWLVLNGRAARRGDYRAGFLVNSETGVFTRLGPFSIQSMRFSADGKTAFFLKPGVPAPRPIGVAFGEASLYSLRLGDAKPSNTGIVLKYGWLSLRGMKIPTARIFSSGDGSRIATFEAGTLSVYDVARKQSLGSVLIGSAYDLRASFLSSEVVRLYVSDSRGLRILEFNVRTKSLQNLGAFSPDARVTSSTNSVPSVPPRTLPRFSLDSTLTRKVVTYLAGRVELCDARTGATIRTLVEDRHAWNARFLRDGRIAIIRVSPVASALMLFSSDGVRQREIALGPINDGFVVEDDGSRAIVLSRSANGDSLLSIDLISGIVERRQEGVGLVVFNNDRYFEVLLPAANAASQEVIYLDTQSHLMAWNPATGATRAVIKG